MIRSHLTSSLARRGLICTIGVVGMGYVDMLTAVQFAASPEFDQVPGFHRVSPTSGYRIDFMRPRKSPLRNEEPAHHESFHEIVDKKKDKCTPVFSKSKNCNAATLSIQIPINDPTWDHHSQLHDRT